jgi:hypothetical protein
MKILIFLAVFFCTFQKGISQTTKDSLYVPRHHVFLEIGGNGLLYSLNYEYRFTKALLIRAGGSYLYLQEKATDKHQHIASVPITMSYLLNLYRQKHYIEVGAGVMLFLSSGTMSSYKAKTDFFPNLTTIIGYRYQPISKHWSCKVAFTPYYGMSSLINSEGQAFNILGNRLQLWGGVGVGYQF